MTELNHNNNSLKHDVFKNILVGLYEKNHDKIIGNSSVIIQKLRQKAFEHFKQNGFPDKKMESWRFTNPEPLFRDDYHIDFESKFRKIDVSKIFTCDVYDLDTYCITLINGWFAYQNSPLSRLKDGTVIGSLYKAMEIYPDIVEKYLGSVAKINEQGLVSLNTAFMQDGLFIYVPDNVKVEKPVQVINIVDSDKPVFIQPRNLIITGKNSNLTLVHCDHSLTHNISFTNTVSEVVLHENAFIDHYKVQNKGRNSALLTSLFFLQEKNSILANNVITLNGGFTRNQVDLSLTDENCTADLNGLYLMDRNQHVDNQVFVDHAASNSRSNQLYKGILDDQASGVFYGKVLVGRNSQNTKAFQNNKNILLTDETKINTQPFLEIYADDVKCSHGATVGQLDTDALFYMRSRGICERTAKQMLMYAFAGEVVKKISIEPLRDNITKLVEKRLKGELSICDQCILNCSSREPRFIQNILD